MSNDITTKKDTLTPSQRLAIEKDGCNILVSASAGAGKTFVMMERIKRLILEKGVNIDKILCVTFTNLAAKEMKEKLSKTLTEEMKKRTEEDRAKLEQQLDLLPTASISTIHAFCKNLLGEFFYEAGIDPAFSVLDEKDSKLLVNRVIDRLFEDLYEEKDEDLQLILPYLFKKRKDKNLKEKVVGVYYSLISEAYPEEILKRGEFYYTSAGVDFIAECFAKEIFATINKYLTVANNLMQEYDGYKKICDYAQSLIDELTIISSFYNESNLARSYEEMLLAIKNISLKSKPRKTQKDDDFTIVGLLKLGYLKDGIKNFADKISEKYSVSSLAEEKARVSEVLPVYRALKKLVIAFMRAFENEKRAENAVDFSDLEHLCLKILQIDEIRKDIAERYDYIFTDEYQDTSGVQEAILSSIARDNLFMVGDIKQSIYDFRGCNPDIFAEKYAKYKNGDGGVAIDLDKNFRSSKSVLTAVNNLFSEIMTKECGRVNYKENPMEVGAPYPDDEGETVMYTTAKTKGEKVLPEGVYSIVGHLQVLSESKSFAEGRTVANIIESLYGKKYYDIKDKAYKEISYGDIAILLRDANKDADKFAIELRKRKIPFSAPSKDSIANYPEVAKIIDILKLIDCYNQDIPLASVLKSELGNLTDGELLLIRKFTPKGSFVDAVNNYMACQTDEISDKLKEFNDYFSSVRLLAEFTPCGELIAKIVSEKGIDIKILSQRLGDIKIARLNKFIEVANRSKQTVSEFLMGLDGLLEKLTMSQINHNAVQIMSIHASKGLEFPIVILAKTAKNFSIESIKGDFLTDREHGVSISHRNTQSMIITETLFNKYIKFVKTKRMREEEMRLLYVAMTRAKSSLYLTAEYTSDESAFPKEFHDLDVYDATSYFKMFATSDFEIRNDQDISERAKESETRQVLIGEVDSELVDEIKQSVNFEYPYESRSTLSVKRSVTQAAHFEEEDTPVAYAPIFNESNTETGNAYHKLLELCDFNLEPEEAFNRAIGSLLMLDEYKNLIDKQKALKILQMPIFKTIGGYNLFKEQPFTCLMPAKMVEEGYNGEEEILIQGIIDLLAVSEKNAIIVDYKHSGVFKDEDLIKRYKKQLELYAFAVNKVLNLKVEHCYLLNVNHCKLIEVKI